MTPGRYIIIILPKWNRFAELDNRFKKIRVGIYAPVSIGLHKLNYKYKDGGRTLGYKALTLISSTYSGNKKAKKLESFWDLHNWTVPRELWHTCFRDIDIYPGNGLIGYISYRNDSPHLVEIELSLEIEGAEIFWPEEAMNNKNFILVIKPGFLKTILFRKKTDFTLDDVQ